jgi:hypothetical protein
MIPEQLGDFGHLIQNRLVGLGTDPKAFLDHQDELIRILLALKKTMARLDEIYRKNKVGAAREASNVAKEEAA